MLHLLNRSRAAHACRPSSSTGLRARARRHVVPHAQRCGVLLACALLVSLPQPARAYVLPADFLCRLLADSHRASVRDVTLTLTATVADRPGSVDERLYFKRPERMRLVQPGQAAQAEQITVSNEGLAASGSQDALKDDGTSPNPWPALWFPRGKDLEETSARMLEAIEAAGIDANVVSLGRYAGGVAYVVGAKPWESNKPQLWLDKASFQPVRILWPSSASGSGAKASAQELHGPSQTEALPGAGMHELRLLNYVGGIPRKLEEWEDGRLLRRSEVSKVVVNQNLPESLFSLPQAAGRR